MTKEQKKYFKKIFNRTAKAALDHRILNRELDSLISQHYQFHYSEYDIEPIIDTLDYGTDKISFEQFIEYMDCKKQDIIE